jgi:hypothetical protein
MASGFFYSFFSLPEEKNRRKKGRKRVQGTRASGLWFSMTSP